MSFKEIFSSATVFSCAFSAVVSGAVMAAENSSEVASPVKVIEAEVGNSGDKGKKGNALSASKDPSDVMFINALLQQNAVPSPNSSSSATTSASTATPSQAVDSKKVYDLALFNLLDRYAKKIDKETEEEKKPKSNYGKAKEEFSDIMKDVNKVGENPVAYLKGTITLGGTTYLIWKLAPEDAKTYAKTYFNSKLIEREGAIIDLETKRYARDIEKAKRDVEVANRNRILKRDKLRDDYIALHPEIATNRAYYFDDDENAATGNMASLLAKGTSALVGYIFRFFS